MSLSNVTTKGQSTIPEEIRLLLNIQPGDKIFYSQADPVKKRYIAEVVSTKNVVDRLAGSLKSPVKFSSKKVVEKAVGQFLAKELGLIK